MLHVMIDQSALDAVPGWLSREAQVFTEHLIDLHWRTRCITGVLELGVFKGKYLSLLAACTRGAGAPLVGVDAFLQRHGVKLIPEHRASAEAEIVRAVASVAGPDVVPTLIGGYTREVDDSELRALAPKGYSFVSVDAGHDADDVEIDAALAERLLAPVGIIAFDDVFNGATPGVAEGLFRYMLAKPRDIAPFATCGNKLFACRPAVHKEYHAFTEDLARNAETRGPLLSRSADHLRANEANGWTPKMFGYGMVPLL